MNRLLDCIVKKFLQSLLREHARNLESYSDLAALANVARWTRMASNLSSVIGVMGLGMIVIIPHLTLSILINQVIPAAMVSVLVIFISAYLGAVSAIACQIISRRSKGGLINDSFKA